MRRSFLVLIAIFLAAIGRGSGGLRADSPGETVRPPSVSGQFYPADPGVLRAALDGFFRDALPARVAQPAVIVVPHAGYVFSGQIAADAYRQVAGMPIDTVVILGANHTSGTFRRVSVYDGAGYRTPLGVARVNQELAAALVREGGAVFDASLHAGEHSVEVQVPFVQYLFPRAAIVPVVVGSPDAEICRRFGHALGGLAAKNRVLIVASSDLSHYPAQGDAVEVDRGTLEAVAGLKTGGLENARARDASLQARGVVTCACGEGAIRVAMEAARALGALRGTVISYANSGDTAVGDSNRVVGYGAVAFGGGEPGTDVAVLKRRTADPTGALDAADKRVLLLLVRETITRHLKTETVPLPRGGSPKVLRETGAFVTLRKHGELRGCIGRMQPEGPLLRLVATLALDSAFRDPRFPPVTANELKDLDVEVSVLTPMAAVPGPDAIVPGRDGVLLRVGDRSAVFLPQVATEQGWNRVELLDNLALKAGLPSHAWRDRNAKFLTFQADVFAEPALK